MSNPHECERFLQLLLDVFVVPTGQDLVELVLVHGWIGAALDDLELEAVDGNHVDGDDGPVGGQFVEDGHVEEAAAHPLEVAVPAIGEPDVVPGVLARPDTLLEFSRGEVLDEDVGGVVVVNPVEELVLGVEELQDLLPGRVETVLQILFGLHTVPVHVDGGGDDIVKLEAWENSTKLSGKIDGQFSSQKLKVFHGSMAKQYPTKKSCKR